MDEARHERIRAAVRAIPEGRVSTYGDVAAAAGERSARVVGWVLRDDGADLPWHRVLRADGSSAPHIADEQHARLREEGVENPRRAGGAREPPSRERGDSLTLDVSVAPRLALSERSVPPADRAP